MLTPTTKIETRVFDAARVLLADKKHVDPIDVLMAVGWMQVSHEQSWRRGGQGADADLETILGLGADKLPAALAALERWCSDAGLVAAVAPRLDLTREHRPLRVTKRGDAAVEAGFARRFVRADLSDKQRARVEEKLQALPDTQVFTTFEKRRCADCKGAIDVDDLVLLDGNDAVCLVCADLDDLVFLPAGDVALTRRAKAKSSKSAVVFTFNRRRKRNERQGLLVEQSALDAATASLPADAAARERAREKAAEKRSADDVVLVDAMAARVRALFPSCPADSAAAIAGHAAVRGSGRVGRSAAGRALDDDAVTLAVIAHVRHRHTDYDALLAKGVERRECRRRIADKIDAVLAGWRSE